MSRIVVTAFMSLDGVMEAPEKWSFPYWNDTIERFKNEELQASDAQLLGRKTYEVFAEAWPSRTGLYADRLNQSHKYVVSSTLQQAPWNGSQVLEGGDHLDGQVQGLLARHKGDVLVHGSHALVQSLVAQDLVDQYHLLVYPLVLGAGKRLFAGGARETLQLERATDMGSGVVLLVYGRGHAKGASGN